MTTQHATDAQASAAPADHVQHGETMRTYVTIYIALMVLLVLTVVASYVNLGHGMNLAVAMTIAIVKAVLVILFFMHVRRSTKLTWVYASAAFLWLAIMFALTFSDYFTRSITPRAQRIETAPTAQQPGLNGP